MIAWTFPPLCKSRSHSSAPATVPQRLVLFGSRARGDNHPRSDIDLAIYGMPERQQASFYFAVEEELQTLLKFDLVHITQHTSPALLQNIQKDGVIIMGSYSDKLKNFEKALSRLQESIEEYDRTHSRHRTGWGHSTL